MDIPKPPDNKPLNETLLRTNTSELKIPDFLFDLSQLAEKQGQKLYLVGGAVRDLLMNCELTDYDLLCDKNAIEFAEYLETNEKAKIDSIHKPFGTAKIKLNGFNMNGDFANSQLILNQDPKTRLSQSEVGAYIDLATARAETYKFPGALPTVTFPVPVEEELIRRDFTINAIALLIHPKRQLEFIDPQNGIKDLSGGMIRVMHEKSYYEDPTRIFRALRFAFRFGFAISENDKKLIREVIENKDFHGMTQRIRGKRFGIELKRLLELSNWLEAIKALIEMEVYKLIRPDLKLNIKNPIETMLGWKEKLNWILSLSGEASEITKEMYLN